MRRTRYGRGTIASHADVLRPATRSWGGTRDKPKNVCAFNDQNYEKIEGCEQSVIHLEQNVATIENCLVFQCERIVTKIYLYLAYDYPCLSRLNQPMIAIKSIQINLDMLIWLEKLVHPHYHEAKWPDPRYVVVVLVNGEMFVVFQRT